MSTPHGLPASPSTAASDSQDRSTYFPNGAQRLAQPPRYSSSDDDDDDDDEEEEEDGWDDDKSCAVKSPPSRRDDDEEEEEKGPATPMDEDGGEDEVKPRRRASPAKPRARKARKKGSELSQSLAEGLEQKYVVGERFEITQDEVHGYEKQEGGLHYGFYELVTVPDPQKITKIFPLQADRTQNRVGVDWEALKKMTPKNAIKYYATAAYLGASYEEYKRNSEDLHLAMKKSPMPSADWVSHLQLFLLPPKSRMGKPVFVTLERAKQLENYTDTTRTKSFIHSERWPMAKYNKNVYENTWQLVYAPSLYHMNVRFLAERDAQKSSGGSKGRSAPRAAPKTREQLLDEKLDANEKNYPKMELTQFMRDRPRIVALFRAAAQSDMLGAKEIAPLNDAVKALWRSLAELEESARAECPEDVVTGFQRLLGRKTDDEAFPLKLLMSSALLFDPDAALSLAEAYERIASGQPITACVDMGQKPKKK